MEKCITNWILLLWQVKFPYYTLEMYYDENSFTFILKQWMTWETLAQLQLHMLQASFKFIYKHFILRFVCVHFLPNISWLTPCYCAPGDSFFYESLKFCLNFLATCWGFWVVRAIWKNVHSRQNWDTGIHNVIWFSVYLELM